MKISVVTAALNAGKTLAENLQSVAAQAHTEVEHILIDGGSTDETLSIAGLHGRHLVCSISEPDRGVYNAMNKGLHKSTGAIVGFLNADDVFASNLTLSLVASAFRDESVMACYGDLRYVKADDTSIVLRHWRTGHFRPGSFSSGWAPPHPTFFARKFVYDTYGGFDETYEVSADAELMMRILERHRLKSAYIPEVLVKMRAGGISNRSATNVLKGNVNILRALRTHGLASNPIKYVAGRAARRVGQFIEARRRIDSA